MKLKSNKKQLQLANVHLYGIAYLKYLNSILYIMQNKQSVLYSMHPPHNLYIGVLNTSGARKD